ncbi:LURP-one-related domain-containing protein [Ditylenchus destructor]|nr:LURP-one-related domain-containing protein [Ditylenchus destructor]
MSLSINVASATDSEHGDEQMASEQTAPEQMVPATEPQQSYPLGKVFQIPTRWVVKQSFFFSDMTIKDAWGNKVFKAIERFGWTMKLDFVDLRTGKTICRIKGQCVFCSLPKYDIFVDGTRFASVQMISNCCTNKFSIRTRGTSGPITVRGDWMDHSYEFRRGNVIIADVRRNFFSLTDSYTVDVQPGVDVIFILACCIIIDKCITQN